MCQGSQAHPMTNSHILQQQFNYFEPASLDGVVALLAEHGERAELLAGGTWLLVQIKQELKRPGVVVNMGRVPGLREAGWSEDHYRIGALATIRQVHTLPAVGSSYQALAEACAAFGSMQIQMTGTIGGNVCNGSPASDAVPALLAFDTHLVLASARGERVVPLSQFLLGPGRTDLQPGEVLTRLLLPRPARGTGSAFIKIARVAADLAKVSAAAVLVRDGGMIVDCKLAFGSVAPTVFRAQETEAYLRGKVFNPELALAAGEMARGEVAPIDDVRSTAWYRRQVTKAVTYDLLMAAWERAGEDEREDERDERDERGERDGAMGGDPAGMGGAGVLVRTGEKVQIALRVNGVLQRAWVAPNDLLLNVLREELEFTGPKYGCGIGECGACTVRIDGRPALACLTLAVAVDGAEIVTVEGLQGAGGTLHPLQEAFLDQQAFQCGYCTPGILMMSQALLEDLPAPDEEDVREYLRGNRCRCTGFASIVRAVLSCVEQPEAPIPEC